MRSSVDALRSLHKYVARGLALGTGWDDWEVRYAWEEGTFRRPFARVGFAGPEQSTGSATLREIVRPFNILIHPPEADAADVALLQATEIGGVLTDLFERGVRWTEPEDPEQAASSPVEVRGAAMRVPLWDWAGVETWETTTRRAPIDYLRVRDLSVNDVADPIDELRRAVGCDVRLTWMREGQQRDHGPLLRGVRVATDLQ